MARKVWKRLRLEAIIAFLVILAIILVSYPTKPAKAVALADDIIIGGAIFSWLAGMGITLSSQLGSNTGTIETMIQGIKNIAANYSAAINEARTWFWGQMSGLISDVVIVANETGKKFVEFGSDVANLITGLGNYVAQTFNLSSGMSAAVSMDSYTSIFIVDGTTVTMPVSNNVSNQSQKQNSTNFTIGYTYEFADGNSLRVTYIEQTGEVLINGQRANISYTIGNHPYTKYVLRKNTNNTAVYVDFMTSDFQWYNNSYVVINDPNNTGLVNYLLSTGTAATLDGIGKDLLPGLDELDEDEYGYVAIPGTVTGALPADPTKSDVMGGMLEEGAAGTITNTGADAATISIADSVPTTPEQPPTSGDLQTPGLGDVFPFCIPFDIYQFFSCLLANREAPRIQATIDLKIVEWDIDIDLSSWNTAATICRTMELLAFCVLLAAKTRDLIRG